MSTLTIVVHTDSAAFEDQPGQEVWRILSTLGRRLVDESPSDQEPRALRDVNGNTVGIWTWTED